MGFSGAWGKLIYEKKRSQQSRGTVPSRGQIKKFLRREKSGPAPISRMGRGQLK